MGYSSLLSPISGSLLLVATHHPYVNTTCLKHGYGLGCMGLQLLAILKCNILSRLEIHILIRYCERSGLVNDECVDTAELLYGCSVLHQNSLLSRLAYANHQGCRCSESHGTRTGYDQYRHGRQNGLGQYCRSAYGKPQHEGKHRNAKHTRHKDKGCTVDKTLHGSLRALRLLYHTYYSCKHRLLAYLLGTETQSAFAYYRASQKTTARLL